MSKRPDVAPEDQIFVCPCCGKTSTHWHGITEGGTTSHGWDVSCAINSVLCYKDKIKFNEAGTICVEIEDDGIVASSDGGAAGEEDGGTPAPQVE